MYLIREIMYCKPGKVKPMVQKFLQMNALGDAAGMPKMRIMTDFAGEQYWTVIAEMEVGSLDEFEKMMSTPPSEAPGGAEAMKKMEEIMKDYHDLVIKGKREIFKIEG